MNYNEHANTAEDTTKSAGSMSDPKIFTVDEALAGLRLDAYLKRQFPDLSRSKIQHSLEDGLAFVNKGRGEKKYIVKTGDVIEIHEETLAKYQCLKIEPEPIHVDILFEDDYLAVINKPAGLVVHPGIGNWSGTLVNGLLYHLEYLSQGKTFDRPGIVHRLDKNTSGAIIIAKTDEAHMKLSDMFAQREILKEYTGITIGKHPEESGTIDAPMGRKKDDPIRVCIRNDGKRAITDYKLIAHYCGISYMYFRLHTGRTHQIRVHCRHKYFPLVQDTLYNGDRSKIRTLEPMARQFAYKVYKLFDRQALHARRIAFTHPITGEELSFTAPYPMDFSETLNLFKEHHSSLDLDYFNSF